MEPFQTEIARILGDPQEIELAIEQDSTGWFESDFEEARISLEKLFDINKSSFDDFSKRWESSENVLGDLDMQAKFQLLRFLLTIYQEGVKLKIPRLVGKNVNLILQFPSVRKTEQLLTLNFKKFISKFNELQYSDDRKEKWADLISSVLKREEIKDRPATLVHGVGQKKKIGRPKKL